MFFVLAFFMHTYFDIHHVIFIEIMTVHAWLFGNLYKLKAAKGSASNVSIYN